MDYTEKTLSSTGIYEGRVISLRRDEVETATGAKSLREVVHHNGGAAVVALDSEGFIYMVRQFRYPYGRDLLEIPAGKIEKGEPPLDTALRELEEETGFRTDRLDFIGEYYPTVAYCDEIIYIYLAHGLSRGERSLDFDENIGVERIPFDRALEMVRNNVIRDGKTAYAILMAKELM